MPFQMSNVDDLELVYSILRDQYPKNKIDIDYNYNTKIYTVNVSKEGYTEDPIVPLDLKIKVVYGDSITEDMPVTLLDTLTNETITVLVCDLFEENEWADFLGKQVVQTERYKAWYENGWNPIRQFIRHKTDKDIYSVNTRHGFVRVTSDHSLITESLKEIKPGNCLPSTKLLHSFPGIPEELGTSSCEPSYENEQEIVFEFENPLNAARMYRSLGKMSPCLRFYNKKHLVCIQKTSFPSGQFLEIVNTGAYTGTYVYDIETESGRFQAGIGELIVKNTDSIFIEFKFNRDDFEKNRLDTFRIADVCSSKLTNEIFNRKPIEMEFEKVFQPFILLTKKRYIGKKFEDTRDPFKLKEITTAGIAMTRRDYCKMVKDCYSEIIDDIVNKANIDSAIGIYKGYVAKIEKYDLNVDSLVLSAQLAKEYKTNPVHLILARKLEQRKQHVQIGDRIPYVFIECSDPKVKKSELGEDPQYYTEHGLKFNRACYLEQLAKPLLGFFKVVMRDSPSKMQDLLDHTNERLLNFGGTKLKNSDFIIPE